jgi:hypothetical protein
MSMTRGIVLDRLWQNQIFSKIGPPPPKKAHGLLQNYAHELFGRGEERGGGGQILFDFLTKRLGIF